MTTDIDEIIRVTTHKRNGGRVQVHIGDDTWTSISDPQWAWDRHQYRVHPDEQFLDKPKPKTVKRRFYRPIYISRDGKCIWSPELWYTEKKLKLGDAPIGFEEREENIPQSIIEHEAKEESGE